MPAQRNVFRIEELSRPPARSELSARDAEAALRHTEIMTELKILRGLLEQRGAGSPAVVSSKSPMPTQTQSANAQALKSELGMIYDAISRTKQEIATLIATGFCGPEMGRVTHELDAVVGGSENATHRILQASEEIEDIAKNLSAAVKNLQDQDLARDILDHVTQIFEACNFQDLAGQRVSKVIATLKFIEDHILCMMDIWGGVEQFKEIVPAARPECTSHSKLVHGPKLDGERGHISQKEIDAMFLPGAA
jgi:chemotaxis protein CheZ